MWEFSAKKTDRLDRLLREAKNPWMSRQAWERLVELGRVKIDERVANKPGLEVRAGQMVVVDLPVLGLGGGEKVCRSIWVGQELGVFFKDPGVPTYPLMPWEKGTFAHEVALYLEQAGVMAAEKFQDLGEPPVMDGGLLQRLDTNTSGLISCAFTKEAKSLYRKLFSGEVRKGYQAIVEGIPSEGAKKLFYSKAPGAIVQAKQEEFTGSQAALLEVSVVAKTATHALIQVFTQQGFRHVIRAGMKALGSPLVGDLNYGAAENTAPFHQLHAFSLQIPKLPEISASAPQSFLDCAKNLGLEFKG